MKTYLKRPSEKSLSTVFYSTSDIVSHFPQRADFRQRIVQPSTKEQQRLLSSTNSPRLQHVHWGKYGIKPIWPSEESLCDQEQHGKKLSKHRSYPIKSILSKSDRSKCIRIQSDSQTKSFLPTIPYLSNIDQDQGLILMTSFASLFILLLVYVIYRRQSTKIDENKIRKQKRRPSLEDNLRKREIFEHFFTPVQPLPTIVEENSPPISPLTSTNQLISVANSKNSESPLSVIDDGRNNNTIQSTSLCQQKSVNTNIDDKNSLDSSNLSSKEDTKAPTPTKTRRSRFEQDSTNDNETNTPAVFRRLSTTHHVIKDEFTSLDQIDKAVKDVGLVDSQLIFGIDYTISNLETGKESFHGLSLHHIQDGLLNPYQSVITIIGRTLEKYDSDRLIPAFGFGDRSTTDRKIFPLRPDGVHCKGFRGVLEAYNNVTPKVRMSGPTNFAPLIREAIRIVKRTRQYHILVIVADGQVTNENQTRDAIVEASNYPLSIVMVGVGDGPWDMMNEFDDSLPTRQFDNFQFVNYQSVLEASTNTDSTFALRALMEIPAQYAKIKELGLLEKFEF